MTRRLLVSIALMTLPTATAAQPPAAQPVVVVRGEGEVRQAPDVAFVSLATETRGKTAREAQSLGATAMSAVHQRLAAAGVPKDALRTLSYDLHPQFDFIDGKQVPRGFLARNVIEVRADDVAKVGEYLETAIGAGGTTVQGVRFDVKGRKELERQAVARAVADARARAAAAAEGAGGTLGPVLRVEEDGVARPVEAPAYRMAAAMAADAAPPIAAGETVIRATVTLTAALK